MSTDSSSDPQHDIEVPSSRGQRQCLICLQPPEIPARLSCSCKFDCCLSCLLEWVRGARHNKERFEGDEDDEHPSRELPSYFAHSNGVCPLCRRPDVILVVDNALLLGGEVSGGSGGAIAFTADAMCTEEDLADPTDVSNRLMREGYALIAKWQTFEAVGERPRPPTPPPTDDSSTNASPESTGGLTVGKKDNEQYHDERKAAYEEKMAEYQKLLEVYEEKEKAFKLPLKQSVHYFINSIVANPANAQGYIGLAYLNLLVSEHELAERYLRFILENIDPKHDDALKLLAYIQSK